MRRLLSIPILHDPVDLGSSGGTMAERSALLVGELRWALHLETLRRFWKSIEQFLFTLAPGGLRLYQDGLAAEGELGRRIVQQAAGRGSQNYQLLLALLDRGARLQKTEDPHLLWQEHELLRWSLEQPSGSQGGPEPLQYQLQRDRFTQQRDRSIAATIAATLVEQEMGVLFMGAHHSVETYLPSTITVEVLKDRQQLLTYVQELFSGQDDHRLKTLAQALSAPVALPT